MPSIHQLVAGFAKGDAISNEALAFRALFRSWGYTSDIFCEAKRILPELQREAVDLAKVPEKLGANDMVLLHLSIGAAVNRVFPQLPGRKAIMYHNITPHHFFTAFQPQIARQLEAGRADVAFLAGIADVNMAVSLFNAKELEAAGYRDVKVLPILYDFSRLEESPGRTLIKRYDDGLTNVLFVGRCAPNKRMEDILTAFYYFQKFVQPKSRLLLAGSYAGTEHYHALLLTMAREMKLENVEILGSLPQRDLNACYHVAHAFLCMSEHEGFCIPLLESMAMGVPVLAYAAGAVPETMDGAGILFHEKRFDLIAETMGRLMRDVPLRQSVLRRQQARVQAYRQRDLGAELKTYLTPLSA